MAIKYELKQVTEEQSVPSELSCDECGAVIPFVFEGLRNSQGRNMLTIVFEGGYGEYIDRINGDPVIHLCGTCADNLRRTNPTVARILLDHAAPLSSPDKEGG